MSASLTSLTGWRVPHLDGVRGLAILLVVAGHVWNGVYPDERRLFPTTHSESGASFVGVEMFFVLSGFLITSVLMREHERTGEVRLASFYGRRARRLLPALAVVIVLFLVHAQVFLHGDERRQALGSAARSALYIENIPPLAERLPTDQWLRHTWSLAVEEQFYILWPILLLLALRRRRSLAPAVAAAGIIVTIVVRQAVVSFDVMNPYQILHWDALLLGCFLALRPINFPRGSEWLGLGILAALSTVGPVPPPPWCYVVVAACCGVVIARATAMRWLTWAPLRRAGLVSYGLYLWHVLLLRFGWHAFPTMVLAYVAAELSFRFVEQPFLRRNVESRRAETAGSDD